MKFDLHIHERTHSKDSMLSLEQIVLEAKYRGLDGVAITDHDVLGLRDHAEFLSVRYGIPVFVGVEVSTTLGDILVFGVDELPERQVDPQSLIDFVNARGGATIAAHPFRDNGRGLGETIRGLRGLTAVEGFNGRTSPGHNARAVELAHALGIPVTGGSDAHMNGEVGGYATWFERPVRHERDLIDALKAGKCRPVALSEPWDSDFDVSVGRVLASEGIAV